MTGGDLLPQQAHSLCLSAPLQGTCELPIGRQARAGSSPGWGRLTYRRKNVCDDQVLRRHSGLRAK